jgi:uncharacterized caspase-like protein
MYTSIKKFTKSIQSGDFVIFFFAGHAVQWGDQNFLFPCDNDTIENRADICRYAINAQETIDRIADRDPRVVLFFLDCCRSYWLPKSGRSCEQLVGGLNQMKAPPGTLIAFACAPGETTPDQALYSRNSIFTKYLLKHVTTPDIDVEKMLRRVANAIAIETKNKQLPYRVSSITEDDVYIVSSDKCLFDYFNRYGGFSFFTSMKTSS